VSVNEGAIAARRLALFHPTNPRRAALVRGFPCERDSSFQSESDQGLIVPVPAYTARSTAVVVMSDDFFKAARKEYERGILDERDAPGEPLTLFREWMELASQSEPGEPNACALGTATKAGRPSVRMVLLKGLDERGFVFFTNYESKKGRDLLENPFAALTFYWASLERQARVEGRCERISAEETDSYFRSRPKGSQLAAAVSEQSRVVASREVLDATYAALVTKVGDGAVPRPEGWGGYRIAPERYEFWQGRENRLHDRIVYEREGSTWRLERLWP